MTEAHASAEALGVLDASGGREDRVDLPGGDHGQQRLQVASHLAKQPGLKSRYETLASMPGGDLPSQLQTPPERVMTQTTELTPQQQLLRAH